MKTPKEIGEILRKTRQKKAITKEKIYKTSRIESKIIDALEEGTADEILNKVYVLLFLRKYASFLELDANRLVKDYKSFYTGEEEQILDIVKEPVVAKLEKEKWLIPAISIGSAILLIFFSVLFTLKPKSSQKESLAKSQQIIFPLPNDKPIELVLESTNNVWMRVKTDGRVVFEDTLPKGKRKKWSAKEDMELWVGRAEALNFTINGNLLGKIGKGKVKNIQLSRGGLKIRNKWLFSEKE